jgi:hypothetical protein
LARIADAQNLAWTSLGGWAQSRNRSPPKVLVDVQEHAMSVSSPPHPSVGRSAGRRTGLTGARGLALGSGLGSALGLALGLTLGLAVIGSGPATTASTASTAPEAARLSCPAVIDLARDLRAVGLTAQAARNAAIATRQDCLALPELTP